MRVVIGKSFPVNMAGYFIPHTAGASDLIILTGHLGGSDSV